MRLAGKVAIITGIENPIGRAIALRFAQEGAIIAVEDTHDGLTVERLVNEIHAIGQQAMVLRGNGQDALELFVQSALDAYRHIDILVNAASDADFRDKEHVLSDEHRFKNLLRTDVRGTFLCCRAIAPIMQAQGSGCIINFSWDYALAEGMAGTDGIIFAAAKGAVHSLSMSLAREYAPTVRVNVIAPGAVDADWLYPREQEATQHIPMGRSGTPSDVAEAALYLASPDAAYITGQTLVVNGGNIMY